ncbi:MAG: type III secretion system protein PrgN [Enterococcus sp.]
MTTNTFVYPHPINIYIISDLGMTVEQFCEIHLYAQSTVATWISRERKVEKLPAAFIYSLALSSSKSMDEVYERLLKLQEEYLKWNEKKKAKKQI